MQIPFTKAHGAKNDFLLTWIDEIPINADLPEIARAICGRHTGVGADGWLLVDRRPGIRLFNSDGSEPELSGNGTRCAAAFLHRQGFDSADLEIATGAGPKRLRLISASGRDSEWEMNMGEPRIVHLHFSLALSTGLRDVTLIDAGNPQCAAVVTGFDFDWPALGAEIEKHPHFPNRTNVSFVRIVDAHTIDVRFFERGAGVTQSSGTGSTGAAACAIVRGLAQPPIHVLTPAGPLHIAVRERDLYLTGPAVLVAEGIFFVPPEISEEESVVLATSPTT